MYSDSNYTQNRAFQTKGRKRKFYSTFGYNPSTFYVRPDNGSAYIITLFDLLIYAEHKYRQWSTNNGIQYFEL